jgi:hypothetical protein
MKVFIPTNYVFRPALNPEAEPTAATVEQTSATVTEPPAEPAPDLDTELNRLDAELATLDELADKANRLPAECAILEKKREALIGQELDSVESIEARSAQMGKISAMRELAELREKKLKAAIAAQQEAVIKIAAQAGGLAEQLWWGLHTKAVAEAEREFSRLFFRAFEHPDVLASYRPVVLLGRLKIPDFRTGAIDTKLVRARQLRGSVDRLREFSGMTFQEVHAELEAQDSEARERRLAKPAGYPAAALETSPNGN